MVNGQGEETKKGLSRKLSERLFPGPGGEKRKSKMQVRIFLICMLILPVLNWLLFWLYVNLNTILLAFKSQRTGAWTLENFNTFYNSLISTDNQLNIAIKNTFLYFGINICVILPMSLFISFFLYKKIVGYKAFRIIFYLPAIISGVAMVTVYTKFIDPRGPLGSIMTALGNPIPPEGLLGRDTTATSTIVVYCIWTGFCTNVLLFSGAMTRIPIELIESAKLEGCTWLKEIGLLILPLIWPTASTMVIFAFTGVFSASGPILLFKPDASNKTMTLSFWIFKQVYGSGTVGGSGSYNLVSCVGLCFTLVGVPIILLARWIIEKIPAVEY